VQSFGNKKTWDTPILTHSIKAIEELFDMNLSLLSAGVAHSFNSSEFKELPKNVGLVYLDPPYIPSKGLAIDYSDFYGFLEGLMDYELFNIVEHKIAHKPLRLLASAWAKKETAEKELREIVKYWSKSHIVLSYRNDGAFTLAEFERIFSENNRQVAIKTLSQYKYALAHSEESSEILLVSCV
jgi:adenine-specific DNA-methyltransferase